MRKSRNRNKAVVSDESEAVPEGSRRVDCGGEQYSYAGKVYGPGVVVFSEDDDETAEVIERAVKRVEKKNADFIGNEITQHNREVDKRNSARPDRFEEDDEEDSDEEEEDDQGSPAD